MYGPQTGTHVPQPRGVFLSTTAPAVLESRLLLRGRDQARPHVINTRSVEGEVNGHHAVGLDYVKVDGPRSGNIATVTGGTSCPMCLQEDFRAEIHLTTHLHSNVAHRICPYATKSSKVVVPFS